MAVRLENVDCNCRVHLGSVSTHKTKCEMKNEEKKQQWKEIASSLFISMSNASEYSSSSSSFLWFYDYYVYL